MKDYGTLIAVSEGVGLIFGPVGAIVGGLSATALGGALHYLPKVGELDNKETQLKTEIDGLQRLII